MSVYLDNPDMPPDSDFEPGEHCHLVGGNKARLLDPRRTPVSVIEVRLDTGTFVIRIDDFEDKGATWEIPFEGVGVTSSRSAAPVHRNQLLRSTTRPSSGSTARW